MKLPFQRELMNDRRIKAALSPALSSLYKIIEQQQLN